MAPPRFDVVIIGAGHNGLVCGYYLAKAGLKVKIFERRDVVGGACVTEEFHPGFKNSVCADELGMLSPKIITDMQLAKHGMETIPRSGGMLTLLEDGRHLFINLDDMEGTQAEIAKFSQKDADQHAAFWAELDRFGALVQKLMDHPPPNFGSGVTGWGKFFNLGKMFYALCPEDKERFVALLTQSIGDYLDSWFESDEIKGAFGYEGSVGTLASPYAGGTAYTFLHHVLSDSYDDSQGWNHVKGGMGSVASAMAKAAIAAGVDIETGIAVEALLIENNAVTGVKLSGGNDIEATLVAGNCTPPILFTQLMDPALLPPQFRTRMQNWRCKSGVFRMNAALSELPHFTTLDGYESLPYLKGNINISPSLNYLEQAYHDARIRGWSRRPMISMTIPSLIDDTLAPEGQHVMSLFCQQFNPELPDGLLWDNVKDEAVETILETVNEYAPNFRKSVLGLQALSPQDLENDFGLTGGDIYHGAMGLDQMFSLRPAAGWANYRTPVKNLYVCGAGAHPGGGVTGLPGHHAAHAMIKDIKKFQTTT